MAGATLPRLGLLAAGVLALHLAVLHGWQPRAPGGGPVMPPGLSVRVLPTAPTRVSDPSPAHEAPEAVPPAATTRAASPAEPEAPQRASRGPAQATAAVTHPAAGQPPVPVRAPDLAAAAPHLAPPMPATPPQALAPATFPPSGAATVRPPGSLASVAPTVAVPPPARWRYEVTGSLRGQPVRGEARLDWQHDGQQYEARMDWGGEGVPARSHRSSGRISAEGLQPLRFAERLRTEMAAHLDAEGGRIVFSGNQPPQAHLPGQQDRLSLLVQVAALIGGEPARYPPGTRLAIPTATARGAEPWLLEVTGEEDLVLEGGAVRTLKLERRPGSPHDQRLEIWLAPAAAHAPVRLRVTQAGGDWLDQRWRTADGR